MLQAQEATELPSDVFESLLWDACWLSQRAAPAKGGLRGIRQPCAEQDGSELKSMESRRAERAGWWLWQPRTPWCTSVALAVVRIPVQVLVGLVNRDNMMVIIRRALAQGQRGSLPPEIEYEDLNKNFVSAAARHLISEQQLAVLQVTHAHSRPAR